MCVCVLSLYGRRKSLFSDDVIGGHLSRDADRHRTSVSCSQRRAASSTVDEPCRAGTRRDTGSTAGSLLSSPDRSSTAATVDYSWRADYQRYHRDIRWQAISSRRSYRATRCICMPSPCVVSVRLCLSQVGVLAKWLNESSWF